MKRTILLISLGLFAAGIAVPVLVFFSRPPVLVVTNVSFTEFYGVERMRRQRRSASIGLFRPVKPVVVADDAGPDVLAIAVAAAAKKPFCVLFPYIQVETAKRYHEESPEIPVVVLSGRVAASGLPTADGVFCVYGTDRDTDMYRAGLMAGIINIIVRDAAQKVADEARKEEEDAADGAEAAKTDEPEKIRRDVVLLHERSLTGEERERFSEGFKEEDPESGVIFARTAAEVPGSERISCVVIAGGGNEYMEKNPQLPLILFSWLDPAFVSNGVAVIFDDSPWALVVPAVRMAVGGPAGGLAGGPAGGLAEGKIPSKPLILSGGFAEKSIFKRLEKIGKKRYGMMTESLEIIDKEQIKTYNQKKKDF
jgi:hypothetical protein